MSRSENSAFRPLTRLRRLRRTPAMRDLLQEHIVTPNDLIYPIFVEENLDTRTPIKTLPGVFRETEESLKTAVREAWDLGIKAIILFGVSHNKDGIGSDAMNPDGLLARMIKGAKEACPEILVIADKCFCEYTDHGHCGVISTDRDVDNDKTLFNLAKQACVAADAGADIIAPSGMMDGMVAAIRSALDESGHTHTPLLSYAAKFASCFYGPFRDAAGCSLEHAPDDLPKDRKTYQMNLANRLMAMREIEQDLAEGADMIMVKPGLPYLDIIRDARNETTVPIFAYHVSGEFALLKLGDEKGMLDYETALLESLLAFKRAGCTGIITYGALDCIRFLQRK